MSSDTRHQRPSTSSNCVRVSNFSLCVGRPEIGLAGDQVDRVPRRGQGFDSFRCILSGTRQIRLHVRGVGILLPQGHTGTRGVLKDGEPALAGDLILRSDDLPASLLDLLLVLVDRVHRDVVDDARGPVSRLQAADAATGPARCLEHRIVHAWDLLKFPSEETRIELLDLLRFLDVELDVHDASGFRGFGHDDSSVAASKRAGLYNRTEGRTQNVRRSSTGLGRTWPELEGRGVDAIPEPGRLGAVVEHVSQVRTAVRALDLGPPHEQAAIFFVPHAPFLGGRPEARPARPGIELGLRGKELSPADDAHVHTGLVVVPVFSRIGTFGPFVDAHLILQRRELFSKLRSVEFLHEDKCVGGRFKVLAARGPVTRTRRSGGPSGQRSRGTSHTMLFLEGRCGEGVAVQEYALIILGSGSGMNFVDALIQENPKIRIAVIDKDEPGGICLTRGCIPTKIMVYPAELVRTMEDAEALGIDAEVKGVSYEKIMKRMRSIVDRDIDAIKEGLSSSENIDYFHAVAEFVSPYTLKVEGKTIRGKMIFLGSGSRPIVPPIKGLDKVRDHTSDSIIRMGLTKRPESIAIIGGGYIAAEFGHFFSAVGSKVT